MKTEQSIVINKDRKNLAHGGDWQQRDSFSQGRVQRLETGESLEQAAAIFMEMQRLKTRSPDWDWHKVAVLAREWSILNPLRSLCEQQGIPLCRYLSKSPPLFRIREINHWLNALKARKQEWLNVKELHELMRTLQGNRKSRPWWQLLNTLLRHWQHEAGALEQPVSQILDYYYESLMAYKQNRQLGEGLLLATVHSAKGMEYEHVFIADGGWQRNQHNEEERRLYYVAMTRAQKTLTLFNNRHQPNSLISGLEGDAIHSRTIKPPQALIDAAKQSQYTLLTLSDIELSYVGRFAEHAPIHQALQQLQVGDELQLMAEYGAVYLCTLEHEVRVAKLSKKASWEL